MSCRVTFVLRTAHGVAKYCVIVVNVFSNCSFIKICLNGDVIYDLVHDLETVSSCVGLDPVSTVYKKKYLEYQAYKKIFLKF